MTMKKKMMTILMIASAVSICVFCFWWWQATQADRLLSISIPKWIAGSFNTSYSIAIHKSQIRPWGTIWRTIWGDSWMASSPVSAGMVIEINEVLMEQYMKTNRPPAVRGVDLL